MKPSLLVLIPLKDASRGSVEAAFDIVYAPDATQRAAAIATHGETIRAVLTNGTNGLTAAEIDRMPQLEFVSALGAGYENLAIDHARSRGIVLVNGAGTNDHCVADHAFAYCWRWCAMCRNSIRPPAKAPGATRCRCARTCPVSG
jgi:Lactate dehydrogenase and related dehydrogenases